MMLDGAPIAYWVGFHVVVLLLIVVNLVGSESRGSIYSKQPQFSFCLISACPGGLFRPLDRPR